MLRFGNLVQILAGRRLGGRHPLMFRVFIEIEPSMTSAPLCSTARLTNILGMLRERCYEFLATTAKMGRASKSGTEAD
jgi:hypothetical protein